MSTFYPTRDVIVKGALRLVNAYSSNGLPTTDQMVDGAEACNMMLKSWQVEGFLWLKKFATLTLAPGQATYVFGKDVNGADSSDACVYEGTSTKIDRPTRIQSAAYRNSNGIDRPLTPMGRDEYMQLTNKATQAPSVQFYYDPQLYQGEITLWPVPSSADRVFFSCDRGIYDLIATTDKYDVPQEWLRLCKWGLAVEIAPEYAVPPGERDRLEKKYQEMKLAIDSYDREPVSSQMTVGR